MLTTIRPLRRTEKGPEARDRQEKQEERGYDLFERMEPLAEDKPDRPRVVTPREVEDGNLLDDGVRLWNREYIIEKKRRGWRGGRKTQMWLTSDIVDVHGIPDGRPIESFGLTGDGMVLPPQERHDPNRVDAILDTIESQVIAYEGIAHLMTAQRAPQQIAEVAQPVTQ